jgi:hypothetical protein
VIILAALAGPAAAAAPPAATSWYDIVADNGDRLGHSSRQVVRGAAGREVVEISEMLVQQSDDAPVRIREETVSAEDGAGRVVRISQHARTGRSWSRLEARIEARVGGGAAIITRQTPSERRSVTVKLPPGTRFDSGGGLLGGWDPAKTPRLEFRNFSLAAMAVETVVIEALPAAAPDAEGRLTVLRKRYDGGELRSVVRLLLDRQHRVVSVKQPMFGTGVTMSLTDRDSALRPHRPYNMLRNAMVKSPYRVPPAALKGQIRYRFAFEDGFEFALPQTREQRTTPERGGVIVDICADCGPGLPGDAATLAEALKPNVWLQSDDRRLTAIAAPIGRLSVSNARKMELLAQKARPYLGRIDFNGHYSALETLSRRAGDCTEAAVLLAALGRAAGIPTRVANGLVYSRQDYHGVSNAFMPHSWTLAWTGSEWRSFDLALDAFDATHIALTIGDGDARSIQAASQLASLLHWENMSEVRTR